MVNVFDELVLDLESILLEVVSLEPAQHDDIHEHDIEDVSVPRLLALLVVVNKGELFRVRDVSVVSVFVLIIMLSVCVDKVIPLLIQSLSSPRRVVDDLGNVQS